MAKVVPLNAAVTGMLANLSVSSARLDAAFAKLSSGLRITLASDDAAALAVSSQMEAEIRSLTQAARNTSDGISVLQTAAGGLGNIASDLTKMAELAAAAGNGLLTNDQRALLDTQFTQVRDDIDHIATSTTFNGLNLLDGSLSSAGVSIQVGADSADTSRVEVKIDGAKSTDLGGVPSLATATVSSMSGAQAAFATIDAALTSVSANLAQVGAGMSRLQDVSRSLATRIENLTAATARIRDVDVARETAELLKARILQRAGVAVLAQANQGAQGGLRLLKPRPWRPTTA